MNLEGFEMFYKSQMTKVLDHYGSGEQARLLIATLTLLTFFEPVEIPKLISKRTYYRHIAMLKQAGIDFTDTFYEKVRAAYKDQ